MKFQVVPGTKGGWWVGRFQNWQLVPYMYRVTKKLARDTFIRFPSRVFCLFDQIMHDYGCLNPLEPQNPPNIAKTLFYALEIPCM